MRNQHEGIGEFGKIATQVAHDIRSPLAVINMFLQHFETVSVDPDYIEFRQLAVRACVRIESMANDLLDYRRATNAQCALIDFAAVVSSVCKELNSLGKKQQTRVIYEGPEKQPYHGDGQQLGRVVQNLVHNAIQALQNTVDGRILVKLLPESHQLQLTIQDNGPGIPYDHMDKLFAEGFTTKKTGNGLGIVYCARVVRAHGGQIQVHNLDERGAEFVITLPFLPPFSL